jgi:toxin ParE1/3/4
MGDFRLTSRAESDLTEIADYTIETFGIEQARRYRDALESCFQMIADNPKLGRSADRFAPKLRCYDHQSHVVFYMIEAQRALIVRILHESRDFEQHL